MYFYLFASIVFVFTIGVHVYVDRIRRLKDAKPIATRLWVEISKFELLHFSRVASSLVHQTKSEPNFMLKFFFTSPLHTVCQFVSQSVWATENFSGQSAFHKNQPPDWQDVWTLHNADSTLPALINWQEGRTSFFDFHTEERQSPSAKSIKTSSFRPYSIICFLQQTGR